MPTLTSLYTPISSQWSVGNSVLSRRNNKETSKQQILLAKNVTIRFAPFCVDRSLHKCLCLTKTLTKTLFKGGKDNLKIIVFIIIIMGLTNKFCNSNWQIVRWHISLWLPFKSSFRFWQAQGEILKLYVRKEMKERRRRSKLGGTKI